MNYQNMLCLGDSQTFGARSYGCYPLYLAQMLTDESPYKWRTINHAVNGYRARDLWFLLNHTIDGIQDTFQACVLIGTNDVGEASSPELFAEYYRQILRTLFIRRYKAVFCGEIPYVFADGHVFFAKSTTPLRDQFNGIIQQVAQEFPRATIVRFPSLNREDYEDAVHFNESGNIKAAQAFKEAILRR